MALVEGATQHPERDQTAEASTSIGAQPGSLTPLYDTARAAMRAAHGVDEVMAVADEELRRAAYTAQATDTQLELFASEIRMRAERRLGQILEEKRAAGLLAKGGGDKKSDQRVVRNPADPPTLVEMGIDKNRADRARKYAAMSEAEFEAHATDLHARMARAATYTKPTKRDRLRARVRKTVGPSTIGSVFVPVLERLQSHFSAHDDSDPRGLGMTLALEAHRPRTKKAALRPVCFDDLRGFRAWLDQVIAGWGDADASES